MKVKREYNKRNQTAVNQLVLEGKLHMLDYMNTLIINVLDNEGRI